jgi:hypothetical protein
VVFTKLLTSILSILTGKKTIGSDDLERGNFPLK